MFHNKEPSAKYQVLQICEDKVEVFSTTSKLAS